MATFSIALVVLFFGCKKDDDTEPTDGTNNITLQSTIHAKVVLGDAVSMAIFASNSVNNTGITTIDGDIGICPNTTMNGFPPGTLTGSLFLNDATAREAKFDLTTAYNDAAIRTAGDMVFLSGNIGGLTLTPGLYRCNSALSVSSGNLTFDAKGDSSAVFIVQIKSYFILSSGKQMILAGGAKASNIFWQIENEVVCESNSVARGIFMVSNSITLQSGADLYGQALSRSGSVHMDSNTIVKQD